MAYPRDEKHPDHQGKIRGRRVSALPLVLTWSFLLGSPRLLVRLALGALAALVASLTLVPLAHANLIWSPARNLSAAGGNAGNPQVAIDSHDRATVVWQRDDGSNHRIQAVRIGADGTSGSVHNLSVQKAFFVQTLPQVAIDSQDRATIVWQRLDGSSYRVQAVRIGTAGSPGPVHNLSAPGQGIPEPQVAIDSHDRATVVWGGSNSRIQSVRIGADGTPGTVHNLSAAGSDVGFPQVAIDSHDRATVVWSRIDGSKWSVQAVRIGADGTPGPVHNLSGASQADGNPQLAIDSHDRATVVWSHFIASNSTIQGVRIGAEGTPGPVHNLSAAGSDVGFPQVAIDSHDRATVVWERPDSSGVRIQSVRVGTDGIPGSVHTLSEGGARQEAGHVQVAIDSHDRATVVWELFDGSNSTIQAVRIGADGIPGSVTDLSAAYGDARFPQVAIDSRDRRTVVWSRFDRSNWRVQWVRGAP